MELAGKVAVVTGGAGGLGAALCRRFAADGAKVAVVDLDQDRCDAIAAEVGGMGVAADVGVEADVQRVVEEVTRQLGPVDLFHSNAGGGGGRELFSPNEEWLRSWEVQVMASVYAARAVVPSMLERGNGYLLGTSSGAALTAEPGSMAYSVTKHAMLALYELLAIEYGGRGITVSCFCPYGMLTPMLLGGAAGLDELPPSVQIGLRGAVTPEVAADVVAEGIREERFLILSHPEALTFFGRKASDYDRWLRGMRRAYGTAPSDS
jgi:NAD(P)-dependent dehydrogenase (short-subunit alcohol dehydrogenase family)